ncbi:crotonase/enoyl-CoA hydratase family protein [Saccharopolyspora sp. WRP15-2]|uniref:Crotonase/enoyl-CoA hydratase family protein n=1 Tax=Saccharopolyspora oryzae TaxID=2997343 RepID=A0ABT4V4P6_9PSEU|nr:crotonase/enoyl-CoA hydratase family protein [Saccharopolyspora oryzae]MDA3628947.1 crotonase/enoyl-CoA hydratase family protein [Saccharopolyspora oryzae]
MSDRVSVETDGPLAHVTMTRDDRLNGLDLEMLRALIDAAAKVRADRSVRAVVLSGAGRSFSAGLDFASVGEKQGQMMLNFLRPPWRSTNLYQEACWAWRRLPVPVLAVIRGHCFGGALQLALGADFRFATPDAQFSVMEAKWGLVPDMSGTATLRELLPMDVAKRLAMTAEVFDGTKAHELGLVTEVGNDPHAAAVELAEQLATRSPDSVAATKRLFQRVWHVSPWQAFRWESAYQLRLLLGANHKIARKANAGKAVAEFAKRTFR